LVLLSDTSHGISQAVQNIGTYCRKWGLTINPCKTKLLVVNATKASPVTLKIDNNEIEKVTEVSYLGIVIDSTGNFKTCMKALYNKSIKAIFKLKTLLSPLPSAKICLHLFDHMIKPVILYGSKISAYSLFGVWNHKKVGTDNIESIYFAQKKLVEKAQTSFGKLILGISRQKDHLAIYGELSIILYCRP